MSGADTWMPLYIGDYLADTMHLNAQEHGAYLLLLMHYWRNGPLPNDDKALSGIARVERRAWEREVGPVVRGFFLAAGGRLHQKRMDVERARAADVASKRRAAADARWAGKDRGNVSGGGSDGGANGYANASPHAPANGHAESVQTDTHARTCAPASQSQSQSEKKERPPRPPSASVPPRGARLPADWSPSRAETEFAVGLGLDPMAVADRFRDFWHGAAGAKGRKADWTATWRNWCRDDVARRPQARAIAAPRPSPIAWMREAEERAGAFAAAPMPDFDFDATAEEVSH